MVRNYLILVKSNRGVADLISALMLLCLTAGASTLSVVSGQTQRLNRLTLVNELEAFYGGELVAVSAVFKNAAQKLPDGQINITNFQNTTGAIDKQILDRATNYLLLPGKKQFIQS